MPFGEEFLRSPGALPPRGEQPWGDDACELTLPGGSYRVEGLSAAQAAAVSARFALWPSRGEPTEVQPIQVRRAEPAHFREVDTRGWEYALDFAFAEEGLAMVGLGLLAEVDRRAPGSACLWLARGEPERVVGDVENLLRVLTAYRLLAGGGVMVHCAAVTFAGRALLAVGRSGAGKTTFSRQVAAGGGLVLSDDLAALRPSQDGLAIDPLPFGGDFGPPSALHPPQPLAAVVRLVQAACDELQPLSTAEGVALLLACAPVVNQDPYRRDALFGVVAALLAGPAAPRLRSLAFTRDGAAWELVRDRLLATAVGAER